MGGPYGAAAGAALYVAQHGKKFLAAIAVLLMLPVLFILMLPSLIFGGLTSSGSSGQPILNDNAAIVQNTNDIAFAVNQILGEGITDAEARIADDINFVPVWYSLFGAKSAVFTYIPNWVKYFDSFDAPELPLVDSEFQQVPDPLSGYYQKSSLRRRLFQVLQLVRFLKARRPAALARGGRARRRKRDSDDSAAP